jgi:hypothetical protein
MSFSAFRVKMFAMLHSFSHPDRVVGCVRVFFVPPDVVDLAKGPDGICEGHRCRPQSGMKKAPGGALFQLSYD